jgi:hypothetical protein
MTPKDPLLSSKRGQKGARVPPKDPFLPPKEGNSCEKGGYFLRKTTKYRAF